MLFFSCSAFFLFSVFSVFRFFNHTKYRDETRTSVENENEGGVRARWIKMSF